VAELWFVLVLAGVAVAVAIAMARDVPQAALDLRLIALAVAALVLGAGMLAVRGAGSELRARAMSAVAGFVFGIGSALVCVVGQQRPAGPTDEPSLKGGAASAAVPLIVGGAGAAMVVAFGVRTGSMSTALFAWAVGVALGSLLTTTSDSLPLVALVTASCTTTCADVAARTPGTKVLALAPLLIVVSCVAVFVGALSVRVDVEEETDAALLRGFAVASVIGALSAIAGSHWWARPSGRGAWLALSAIVATVGSTLVLLIGRYYDDPLHRAARALARAQRGGPRTRFRTGLRFGAESAAIVLTLAVLTALAARRLGETLGIEHAGELGLAVAALTTLASRSYLDAIATRGEARTLAHDLFIIALVLVLLLFRYASVALTGVVVVAALALAAIFERMSAAHVEDEGLRRRAAVLAVLAGGVLAASALFEAVLGT
jgi:hypothetical protein